MILRHYCIKHTFTRCSFWVGHIISCRKLKPFIVRCSRCRYSVIESKIIIHNLWKTYCLGNKLCILHNIIHHWHKFALVHFNFRIVLVGIKHPLNIFRWTIFEVSTPISKGTNRSFQPINTETNFSNSDNESALLNLLFFIISYGLLFFMSSYGSLFFIKHWYGFDKHLKSMARQIPKLNTKIHSHKVRQNYWLLTKFIP